MKKEKNKKTRKKKKSIKKRKGYWKAYDLRYKKYDLIKTYTFILRIIKKLNRPSIEGQRIGRSPALSRNEYMAVLILKLIYTLSLRDLETLSNVLHNKHIDHSTYGKAFKRIDYTSLLAILTFTYVIIANLVKQPSNKIYIADSTGVSITRLYKESIYRGKRTKRRVFDKLHILACYYPKYGYIPVVTARWSTGYSSDSTNLLEMLKQIDFLDIEYLLADRGYDCCELFEYLLYHNITPIIKTKESKRDYKVNKFRKRIKNMFNQNLYRYRGVVESIFGGLESKNRLKLNDRLLNSRRNSTIAAAIVHNISILMRLSVLIHNTPYSS